MDRDIPYDANEHVSGGNKRGYLFSDRENAQPLHVRDFSDYVVEGEASPVGSTVWWRVSKKGGSRLFGRKADAACLSGWNRERPRHRGESEPTGIQLVRLPLGVRESFVYQGSMTGRGIPGQRYDYAALRTCSGASGVRRRRRLASPHRFLLLRQSALIEDTDRSREPSRLSPPSRCWFDGWRSHPRLGRTAAARNWFEVIMLAGAACWQELHGCGAARALVWVVGVHFFSVQLMRWGRGRGRFGSFENPLYVVAVGSDLWPQYVFHGSLCPLVVAVSAGVLLST